MNKKYNNLNELKRVAEYCIDIKFKDLGYDDFILANPKNKGSIGQFVEENIFQYKCNNSPEPDIAELGVEIKTSPFIYVKNGTELRSKERLVLNMINYNEDNLDSFEKSHLWNKNKKQLILFYRHNNSVDKKEWFIEDYLYRDWTSPEFATDLEIIKNDWKIITDKIKQGKAHELSEADTMYLGACTKGKTAENSFVTQPFSNALAKKRAFCLKNSYMNYLININTKIKNHDINYSSSSIVKDGKKLKSKTLEEYIIDIFKPFVGTTTDELISKFNIDNKKSKQINSIIVKNILNIDSFAEKSNEFQKANIEVKTIVLDKNGVPTQHMSFPKFEFKKIINQTWEESDFYQKLSTTKFMFVVFKINSSGKKELLGTKFWNMPQKDMDTIERETWNPLIKVLREGVILKYIPPKNPKSNGRVENNLPKSSETSISHVRNHSSKTYYRFKDIPLGPDNYKCFGDELPNGDWMTSQCFWLNKKYVMKISKL